MKLNKCSAQNFASYDNLDLDFHSKGCVLVHGPTGSGKSTLLDLVCWALYGVTAKDGNVDEVRSWNTPTQPTKVTLDVLVKGQELTITRIRGAKPSQNDLYWTDVNGQHRGKDLNETQKYLEAILGCTAEQYLTGAYFHEFSKTGTFFLSKAKDRRLVFENIADLSFPATLAERAQETKKDVKKHIKDSEDKVTRAEAKLEQLDSTHKASLLSVTAWTHKNTQQIQDLEAKAKNFESDKAYKIKTLEQSVSSYEIERGKTIDSYLLMLERFIKATEDSVDLKTCQECGALKNTRQRKEYESNLSSISEYKNKLKNSEDKENPYLAPLELARLLTNQYDSQIEAKKSEDNPFVSQINTVICDIDRTGRALVKEKDRLAAYQQEYTALDSLYDLSFQLRGALLKRSIKQVEEATNRYLETYFDSELRVVFSLEDSDELKTELFKNGNSCVYSQLSKGQRGLLKLTFAVSIMDAVSTSSGIGFNTVFFDEALDGLDSTLKVKAFRLFEDLATKHDSVYVIDHSEELKSMFDTKIQVYMESDISQVTYE